MAPSLTGNENGDNISSTESPIVSSGPLAGKVALITGSSRGIGKGMALELASRGASIVVNYAKSAEKAQEVVVAIKKLGSKAIALQCDVSKPDQIFKMFEDAVAHFGKLDIVCSNSGTEVWSKEEDVTADDFDYIFNINCRGQFFVAQQGLKYLGRGGRIILMSSVAATMSGIPNHALYAGSKAAVEGFTRSFSVDCGEKGITVNAIAPGGVKTDMYDENAWVSLYSVCVKIQNTNCLLALRPGRIPRYVDGGHRPRTGKFLPPQTSGIDFGYRKGCGTACQP